MIQDFNEIDIIELKEVLENNNKKIIFPLFEFNSIHYIKNNLISFSLYDIIDKKIYSFNIKSNDLQYSNNECDLIKIKPNKLFIKDSPYFYKYWGNDIHDIDLAYWIAGLNPIKDFKIQFQVNSKSIINPGLIVPWIKFLESVYNYILVNHSLFEYLNINIYEKLWNEIYRFELNGIKFDNNIIYTKYSTITKTGRPTATFQGVNMLALSKIEDRLHIQPRPGNCLFEFDWDASHIRLIANLINFNFSKLESVHNILAKIYLQKDEISEIEYSNCKLLTFKYLYGEVDTNIHPYFSMVQEFKSNLYEEYVKNKFIKTPITNRKIFNIEDHTPSKVLNYLIQAYESEFGLIKIKLINDLLCNTTGKLILWTYDSFLFDLPLNDNTKQILKDIKNILESDNMKVHIKYGLRNFSDLKILKLE